MKNEAQKIQSKSDSKSQDYLLVTSVGEVSRKIIWNDQEPLKLDHPKGWMITKIDSNICIYDSSDPDPQSCLDRTVVLPSSTNDSFIKLPPAHKGAPNRSIKLAIHPLVPLEPPYMQVDCQTTSQSRLAPQVIMYQGVRYFLVKYRPVGKKLTIYAADGLIIFAYERLPTGCYSITAQAENVIFKTQGKKLVLPKQVPYILSDKEFFSSVFIYGIHWCRFRAVPVPNSLPPREDDESEDLKRETRRFRLSSQAVVAVLCVLLLTSLINNYFFPPEPAPVITKIDLRTPKVIPHKEIAEVKPTPTPVPIPTPVPKPPVIEKQIAKVEKPKKQDPPPQVAKKEPPKVEKPKKVPPQQVAKKETPPPKAPPAPPPPEKKMNNTPPAPGEIAKKSEAPPAPDQSAQLLKSLSFLSSGSKNSKKGSLTKYDKVDFINAPNIAGGSKDTETLNKLSNVSGDTNIKTKSSRTIATNTGFDAPKGKGLNDVQGKVSLTELYTAGNGYGGGFEDGAGISLSGPGELSDSAIEKALSKYIARFQFCYEKSLLSDSSLAGNIRLQWTISTSGSVSDAKVLNSQMKNAALHSCITNVLKEITFPQPKGGSVIAKKTFSFKSSSL